MTLTAEVRDAVTIDFETDPIAPRPDYPPKPCGVAIRYPGKGSRYYAWGHRNGQNNCTYEEGRAALAKAWNSRRTKLFHNAGFDQDVAELGMGMRPLAWDESLDTVPMLFLSDPHAPSYSLKPSAERILGEPPEEQDALIDWLITHQPVEGRRLGRAKGPNYAGAHVAWAPPSVAGPYALGDVDRTYAIAVKMARELERRGMVEPLQRERRLLPHLRRMEAAGVRVDMARLRVAVPGYELILWLLTDWLQRRLRVGDGVNLDSGAQLALALIRRGYATEESLGTTRTGKVSTTKDALDRGVTCPTTLAVLRYRSRLKKSLEVMRVWLEVGSATGGRIYTTWHSTRRTHGTEGVGARTGRLSSTPNFQNLAKAPPRFFDGKGLPRAPLVLPPLPQCRSYIVPERGHVFIDRDYSQQELRLLAQFERGALLQGYKRNPWLDAHDYARDLIRQYVGVEYPRGKVKTTNFGLIYGMGVGTLAERTGSTVDEAKALKAAVLSIFPGLKKLYGDARACARNNTPVRTWGGREYYCEPSKVVDGKLRQYDYKLPNAQIQGSGADVTKQGVINFHEAADPAWSLKAIVHDENVVSVPRKDVREAMECLRQSMEGVATEVAMLTEGKVGPNLQDLRPYDSKGKRV